MRDSLGRRRRPTQSRGLRPLYPPLTPGLRSEPVRVAMSERGWAALEREALHTPAPTHARAVGRVIERALGTAPDVDWLQWQVRKEKQLLGRAS